MALATKLVEQPHTLQVVTKEEVTKMPCSTRMELSLTLFVCQAQKLSSSIVDDINEVVRSGGVEWEDFDLEDTSDLDIRNPNGGKFDHLLLMHDTHGTLVAFRSVKQTANHWALANCEGAKRHATQ